VQAAVLHNKHMITAHIPHIAVKFQRPHLLMQLRVTSQTGYYRLHHSWMSCMMASNGLKICQFLLNSLAGMYICVGRTSG